LISKTRTVSIWLVGYTGYQVTDLGTLTRLMQSLYNEHLNTEKSENELFGAQFSNDWTIWKLVWFSNTKSSQEHLIHNEIQKTRQNWTIWIPDKFSILMFTVLAKFHHLNVWLPNNETGAYPQTSFKCHWSCQTSLRASTPNTLQRRPKTHVCNTGQCAREWYSLNRFFHIYTRA
jgi:hypothetical protein